MMSRKLYFIHPIVKALQERHVRRALVRALREIKKTDIQDEYSEGVMNFKLFMSVVYSHHEAVVTGHIRQLIVELATGTFEGTEEEKNVLSDILCLRSEWMVEYLTICRQEAREDLIGEAFPVIAVLHENGPAKEVVFTEVPGCKSLCNVLPGNYRIKLVNTGWRIWDGELTAKELIWSEAHKGENLRAAADDAKHAKAKEKPTREIDLLQNGDMMLRTYAGAENGRIEIELTR
jgi:hypothetical protein